MASQVKSLVQAAKGNKEDALATQEHFTERCVCAAQVRSIVQACRGDVDGAAETQRRFLENARRLLGNSEVADAVPVVSQFKALALIASPEQEDTQSAVESQRNFLRRCPVVSQACSAYELVTRGPDEALEGQREFIRFASSSVDKVPGIGHMKAWAHKQMGDEDRAATAFAAAERSRSHGAQQLTRAMLDIIGRQSGHPDESAVPPEAMANSCGPLDEMTIRRNTLIFQVTEDQLRSHSACPICLVDFRVGEEALTLRCFHVFHPRCGERWLRENGNCPVCRVGAAPSEVK